MPWQDIAMGALILIAAIVVVCVFVLAFWPED